jgi:tetraacyldisaccharide 4'-kinase
MTVKELPIPVISVGNLTVGGTGKTPLSIVLARLLVEEGYRVAVLSRGYGGAEPKEPLVVSDGTGILETDPDIAGDEALLIARRVPKAIVLVSPNRYASGRVASDRLGAEVAILDDGFQHLSLRRDVNILVLRGAGPWGNGHLLPRGPLREPLCACERADVVAQIGEPGPPSLEVRERLGIPFLRFDIRVRGISELGGVGQNLETDEIRGKKVYCFAGIGTPGSFEETVKSLGVDLAGMASFGDHHRFTEKDLDRVIESARDLDCEWVLTTEKDGVKIERLLNGRGSKSEIKVRLGTVAIDLQYDRKALWDVLRPRRRLHHHACGEV